MIRLFIPEVERSRLGIEFCLEIKQRRSRFFWLIVRDSQLKPRLRQTRETSYTSIKLTHCTKNFYIIPNRLRGGGLVRIALSVSQLRRNPFVHKMIPSNRGVVMLCQVVYVARVIHPLSLEKETIDEKWLEELFFFPF